MSHSTLPEITQTNFESEVEQSVIPVLVDFSATWCGPCKMQAPILEQLQANYQGKYKFVKIDIDTSPSIATKFGIRSVPTLLIFKGGKIVQQHVGLADSNKVLQLLSA
ncbi:thioredoxin [Pajaroellobacter abortibovis]|uniref:Thioredoxin n=1 Tax=Pajaroellobacter abortibovis TaxID=1882918 RepID=A0A1L6MZ69_9BACT|nr:thioredoxin [Pajaroellobacter abortibovis]APS00685.1 thioredoxin [Pajaroellobacter abortibovis]